MCAEVEHWFAAVRRIEFELFRAFHGLQIFSVGVTGHVWGYYWASDCMSHSSLRVCAEAIWKSRSQMPALSKRKVTLILQKLLTLSHYLVTWLSKKVWTALVYLFGVDKSGASVQFRSAQNRSAGKSDFFLWAAVRLRAKCVGKNTIGDTPLFFQLHPFQPRFATWQIQRSFLNQYRLMVWILLRTIYWYPSTGCKFEKWTRPAGGPVDLYHTKSIQKLASVSPSFILIHLDDLLRTIVLEYNETEMLMVAFKDFAEKSCVQFVPRRNERDYVFITTDPKRGWVPIFQKRAMFFFVLWRIKRCDRCLSYIGWQGGRQEVFLLRPNCFYLKGTIIHELMHT